MSVDPLSTLLRQYVVGLSDATRGAILTELKHSGELTATQLARRLGLTVNNVYHHMRVLTQLGIVERSRVVPGPTYVEKYYRLPPDLRAVVTRDPDWLDRTQATLTPAERQELMVGMCLNMAQLLQRAAQRYAQMDAEKFDHMAREQQLLMLSINEVSRKRLQARLQTLSKVLRDEHESGLWNQEGGTPHSDMVLMAGLPLLWDEE
jgi:DNA-binding transcriptional ArsR family regulator